MTIDKCDICKKQIKNKEERIYASQQWLLSSHLFCAKCGKPILNFLKRQGLTAIASEVKRKAVDKLTTQGIDYEIKAYRQEKRKSSADH
jgi:hypothetical protein